MLAVFLFNRDIKLRLAKHSHGVQTTIRRWFSVFAIFALKIHLCAQVTFAPVTNYTVGKWPDSALAVDVNADGKVDLVCKNSANFSLSVLTNTGSGDFVPSSSPNVDGGVAWMTTGDMNGDAKVDLICESYYNLNTLAILTNDGAGNFALSSTITMPYESDYFVTADMNGDNLVDLLKYNGGISIYTNDAFGSFLLDPPYAESSWSPPTGGPSGGGPAVMVAADVNGDGKTDVILGKPYDNTLSVMTNNGSGVFVLSDTLISGNGCYTFAVGDVNGDGRVDLCCANSDDDTLLVFTNNGNACFATNAIYTTGPYPYSVTTADINGDGKLDLAYADNGSNTITILTNNGSGGFVLAATPNVGSGPSSVTTADLNGDGKLDLICSIGSSNMLAVLINTSVFQPPTFVPSLTIKQQTHGIHVSWSSSSPGWSLQQNTNLVETEWSLSGYCGYAIVDDGTNKSLTIPLISRNLFFRLLHP